MRDRIDLICPGCEVDLGQVIFDDRMVAEIRTVCPECRRELRLFVNDHQVFRKQYPAQLTTEEGER